MKKNILFFLPLLFLTLTAAAQLEKGTVLLGGGVGFNTSTSTSNGPNSLEKINNSGFNFSPDAGYFFKDNWVVGLSLPLSWNTVKRDYSPSSGQDIRREDHTTSFGLAPFVRKYFPIGEKFSFYGQAQLGYSHSSLEFIPDINQNDNRTTAESNKVYLTTALGLSYFPKKWLGLNISISPLTYNYYVSDKVNDTEYEVNNHTLEFGANTNAINLGANFFLSKK